MDRFKQIEPSVIFSVDAVWYNGKIHDHLKKLEKVAAGLHTLKHVIVIPFVHKESELNISDIPKRYLFEDNCLIESFLVLFNIVLS